MKSDREHSGGAGGTVVKGCGGGANTGRARVGGGGTSPMNSTVFASLAGDRRGSGGGTAPTAPVPVPVVDPGGGGTSITVADGAPPAPESGATRARLFAVASCNAVIRCAAFSFFRRFTSSTSSAVMFKYGLLCGFFFSVVDPDLPNAIAASVSACRRFCAARLALNPICVGSKKSVSVTIVVVVTVFGGGGGFDFGFGTSLQSMIIGSASSSIELLSIKPGVVDGFGFGFGFDALSDIARFAAARARARAASVADAGAAFSFSSSSDDKSTHTISPGFFFFFFFFFFFVV